jgi:hypothetical protein
MRNLLILMLIAATGFGWWKRDELMARYQSAINPTPTNAQVYRWKDAQGNLHFSTQKPNADAQAITLKQTQTMPGMSKAQIDAVLHPKPQAGDTPAAQDCEQVAPLEQAKCINAQMAQRNVAIEKMEKKLSGSE